LGTGSSEPTSHAAQEIRIHGLLQEVEELKKVNRMLQDEKE